MTQPTIITAAITGVLPREAQTPAVPGNAKRANRIDA